MNFAKSLILTPRQLQMVKATTSTMQPRIPQQPMPADVPARWAQTYLPPGLPLTPMGWYYPPYREAPEREPKVQSRIIDVRQTGVTSTGTPVYSVSDEYGAYQFTPRSYQYPPSVNTTITPRISYGLMPFSQIQTLSQDTPDVMLCQRLLKRLFLSLVPKVKHDDGEECHDDTITHIVDYPDGYHPMGVWLSRWYYNGVIYDAPALHMVRDNDGYITALVNIDGSTIFVLIDENGNPPKPPAPAYLQIIWGTPYGFASTEQLWYRPNDLRVDSQYGTSLAESANLPVTLLNNIWKYETAWFTAGTLPEYVVTAPAGWTNDQVAQWLIEKNNALAGNPDLRMQFDAWPNGFQSLVVKSLEFRKEIYDIAKREVMEHAGLPIAEIGETQHQGLGGRGYMDAMSQAVFRQALMPWMRLTSAPFNDVFAINHRKCKAGKEFHELVWDFPPASIDPEKQEKKVTDAWLNGGLTLGAYREAMGQEAYPENDARNELIHLDKGAVLVDPEGKVWASAAVQPPKPGEEEEGEGEGRGQEGIAPNEPHREQSQPPQGAVPKEGERVRKRTLRKQVGGHWVTLDDGRHVYIDAEAEYNDGKPYWRYAPEDDPMSEWGHAMFSAKQEHYQPGEAGEGNVWYRFDPEKGDPSTVSYWDVKDEIGEKLSDWKENGVPDEWLDTDIGNAVGSDENTVDELVQTFNPKDIVNSAEAYDNADFNRFLYDEILEPHGYTAIVTNDGAVVYDPEKIRAVGKMLKRALLKHCGVCDEDDAYYGAPISHEVSIPAPVQGANETEIVAVTPDGMESRPFAWKPEGNENENLVEAIGHPQYLAEEAVYALDRALQFYLVPVSFVSDVDHERGVAIHWTLDSGEPHEADEYAPEWIEKAAALDYITGQVDREHDPDKKNPSWLTHPDDDTRPVLIDNGMSFPANPDRHWPIASDFVKAQGSRPLSAQTMDALGHAKTNVSMWAHISQLVGTTAVAAAQQRLGKLIDGGSIPHNGQNSDGAH